MTPLERLWSFYMAVRLWLSIIVERDFWGIDYPMSREKLMVCWQVSASIWLKERAAP
jgi:hypothetical protein